MPSLQIREMPEDVYEALALRARLKQRSMAQQAIVELRRIPELLGKQRRLEVLHHLRKRIESGPARPLPVPPADLIREDRQR